MELLNTKDLGITKRTIKNIKKFELSSWLDKKILPIIALLALNYLAVEGLMKLLVNLPKDFGLIISIILTATLSIKIRSRK